MNTNYMYLSRVLFAFFIISRGDVTWAWLTLLWWRGGGGGGHFNFSLWTMSPLHRYPRHEWAVINVIVVITCVRCALLPQIQFKYIEWRTYCSEHSLWKWPRRSNRESCSSLWLSFLNCLEHLAFQSHELIVSYSALQEAERAENLAPFLLVDPLITFSLPLLVSSRSIFLLTLTRFPFALSLSLFSIVQADRFSDWIS